MKVKNVCCGIKDDKAVLNGKINKKSRARYVRSTPKADSIRNGFYHISCYIDERDIINECVVVPDNDIRTSASDLINIYFDDVSSEEIYAELLKRVMLYDHKSDDLKTLKEKVLNGQVEEAFSDIKSDVTLASKALYLLLAECRRSIAEIFDSFGKPESAYEGIKAINERMHSLYVAEYNKQKKKKRKKENCIDVVSA